MEKKVTVSSQLWGESTKYVKNENKKLSTAATISDLDKGNDYWFKGSSGEYEVKISGNVADPYFSLSDVKLEFSVIFKE